MEALRKLHGSSVDEHKNNLPLSYLVHQSFYIEHNITYELPYQEISKPEPQGMDTFKAHANKKKGQQKTEMFTLVGPHN